MGFDHKWSDAARRRPPSEIVNLRRPWGHRCSASVIAASVNYPSSVCVFGLEQIDGTTAISMELVTGGTLKDRIAGTGLVPK